MDLIEDNLVRMTYTPEASEEGQGSYDDEGQFIVPFRTLFRRVALDQGFQFSILLYWSGDCCGG